MLLSIVIPSFQQGSLLRNALESIKAQTFKDYEVLVMDGGSVDTTAAVVAEFSDLPIRFYAEPDKGIYDAMNKGIERSNGDFLYFMGCDDSLAASDVLEKIFTDPALPLTYVIYGDVVLTGTGIRHDGEFDYYKLYIYNICHQAVFTHRKVFKILGNFDLRYKTFADWEFNMRWFDAPWVKRKYVPLIVANFNTTGLSSTFQDEIFFAEQAAIKQRHFPKIVRYLAVNQDKKLHRFLRKILPDNRIVKLNFLRNWIERV